MKVSSCFVATEELSPTTKKYTRGWCWTADLTSLMCRVYQIKEKC